MGIRQEDRRRQAPQHGAQSICLGLLIASGSGYVAAEGGAAPAPSVQVHIDSQPLPQALAALATQTGMQLVYHPEDINTGVISPAVSGSYTPDKALTKILDSSGLSFYHVNSHTIALRVARADAEVAAASSGPTSTRQPTASSDSTDLAEVVVTAQKREERLIDTPQSVSVVSSEDINKLGATQFRDFANTIPGLTFTTAGAGYTQISLRGITLGQDTSATVGIYVDEVPFGSSTGFSQGGQLALDVALLDLDRVEVLRGPQGTLYGASTMGGLIKYVSKRPDENEFSGHVQAGASGTEHGSVNYETAGSVNIPLVSNRLAVRASAFESHDGGYIDNVALDQDRVNRSDVYGGRLDLFFTPTDALSVRLGGFIQEISRSGQATADYTFTGGQPYGSLGQHREFAEPFDQNFKLASATVDYNFGPATLTSISSYQTNRTRLVYDFSALYVGVYNSFGLPYSAFGLPQTLTTDKFTEEVRLASGSNQFLEWLVGGFYTHETSANTQSFTLLDLQGQPAPNTLYTFYAPSHYKESAGFADLTLHITSQFDISGGIRYAHNTQDYTQFQTGIFGPSTPTRTSSESVPTYLGNARYHFTDHMTAYARYATGYRPGGPNFVGTDPATGRPVGPTTFQADRLKSYEAGIKAETDHKRFGIDLAGYYIDWTNIQVLTTAGGFSVYANAPGGAKVHGAELTLTARPIEPLSLTTAFAYTDAHLAVAAPDVGGLAGERLPNVPRFTASGNADYDLWEGGLQPRIGTTNPLCVGSLCELRRQQLQSSVPPAELRGGRPPCGYDRGFYRPAALHPQSL